MGVLALRLVAIFLDACVRQALSILSVQLPSAHVIAIFVAHVSMVNASVRQAGWGLVVRCQCAQVAVELAYAAVLIVALAFHPLVEIVTLPTGFICLPHKTQFLRFLMGVIMIV
jgi:hypothetical protein